MEIKTVKIKTTHDLRPIIDLLDQTEETVDALIALIGLGAARAAEFAADEQDDVMRRRARDVMNAAERVCVEWRFCHGKG